MIPDNHRAEITRKEYLRLKEMELLADDLVESIGFLIWENLTSTRPKPKNKSMTMLRIKAEALKAKIEQGT